MKWRNALLPCVALGCLLASATACGGSSANPYERRETIHSDSYPPDYYPGYNPRGPGRHSMGFTSYGRPER